MASGGKWERNGRKNREEEQSATLMTRRRHIKGKLLARRKKSPFDTTQSGSE